MATLETAISILSAYPSSSSSLSSSSSSSSYKLFFSNKPPPSIKLQISYTFPSCLFLSNSLRNPGFQPCSSVQEATLEENQEQTHDLNQKKKLYIFNLPWSFSVVDIKELFGQCGTVTDVEIIKQKNGRSRGFAFITMASGEEAQAAIDKFDSQEISGRIVKVELAKRMKKPPPPTPPGPPPGETRNKLYVSNIAWKARSVHLREFFSENFNPTAGRIVLDSASGKSAGYGFVSFATREEAEAALSSLDGKELMGRPLRLKFSEKNDNESEIPGEDDVEGEGEAEGS